MWDEGEPKKAFDIAIKNSNKVAMSLSDLFCVERHKSSFLQLVKENLDITFSNEQEIMSLLNTKKIEDVVEFSKNLKKLLVITRGEKGALAIKDDTVVECDAKKNPKISGFNWRWRFICSRFSPWIHQRKITKRKY